MDRARSSFFDLSVDLLCIASLDGRFLDLNPAWTTLLGWELDELVGRQYLDFVHPDDLELTIAAINELRLGQSVRHFRNRYRHHDGSWRWLEWTSRGEPAHGVVYAVAHDITLQQHLEAELRDANDELRTANELKDHFLATASHELRTPLTSITGFSATVLDRWTTLTEQDRQRFVGIIDAQATRLSRLVDELLDMSRLDAGTIDPRRERVLVRPILEEAVILLDGTDAALACDPDFAVIADPDYLAQVLINLVANAARHGRPPILVEAADHDGRGVIAVVDHGDGVSEDFRPYLFEKFTQGRRDARQSVEGAGLGLSIARGLVRAMGGELSFEPVDPSGARFVINLPTSPS